MNFNVLIVNFFVTLEMEDEVTEVRYDVMAVKDNIEGVADDMQAVKDDLKGMKDGIQNVGTSVSGKCRHSSTFKWILKSLNLK